MGWAGLALALLVSLEARAQEDPDPVEEDVPPAPNHRPTIDPSRVVFPGGYRLEPLAGDSARVEVGGGEPLSLGQVVSSVELHHPTLVAARAQLDAARGDQLAAEGGFDTQLYASGWGAPVGYYDWGRADVMLSQPTPLWGIGVYAGWRIGRGAPVPDYYGNYETLDLGEARVGVTVPLLRDGPIDSRRARIWQAEHGTRAQEASLEGSLLSMRLEAAYAYWAWVAAGQRYAVAAQLLDLAEARDTQIGSRVASGAIPPIESLENRRVVLSRRTSLVSARRALEQAAITLSLYLRTEDGAPRVPRPDRVPLVTPQPETLDVNLRREIEATWARRPDVERYRARIDQQEVSVDLAHNQLLPRLDVGVQGSIDLGSGSEDEQTTLGPPVLAGSVTLSMPLQLREAQGSIRRERAELAALRAEAQLVRDRVASEVQDALSAVRAAEERVQLADEAATVAEAVAEAERRRFELGATQLFIVNLREQAAAEARATLVDARAALQQAHARWDAVTARRLDQGGR